MRGISLLVLVVLFIGCNRSSNGDVLATVNGVAITREELENELQSLPDNLKEQFLKDKTGFLEELISRELLYQEAQRRGIDKRPEFGQLVKNESEKKALLIKSLIEDELSKVKVSEDELLDLYREYKDQIKGDFESVKSELSNFLLQQKQREHLDLFLRELKSKANITRNEKWIQSQTRDNPLDRVLGKGKPVLADFGRGVCIPCKMMKPILEELQKEYEGRVHVMIIEIDPYRELTRRHRIRVIPTQIFFDKDGNEYYRHEGFMSKEDIVTKFKEMGVK